MCIYGQSPAELMGAGPPAMLVGDVDLASERADLRLVGEERCDEAIDERCRERHVGVDEHEDRPRCPAGADVAGRPRPAMDHLDHLDARVSGDGRGAVPRSVVNDDHLDRCVRLCRQACKAAADEGRLVVRGDHDRHERSLALRGLVHRAVSYPVGDRTKMDISEALGYSILSPLIARAMTSC